jgi:uncharacterized protein YndB with AHSA1/START domain
MKTHEHTAILDAPADAVFATLTDLDRLADWNRAIVDVTERPGRLAPGAEWVVTMHAMGQTWASRSKVVALEPATGRFHYRSCTDDGNPSWAEWTWTVQPIDAARSSVRVSWALNPKTFWRRVLFVRIRARQLRRTELPRSLAQLADASATGG